MGSGESSFTFRHQRVSASTISLPKKTVPSTTIQLTMQWPSFADSTKEPGWPKVDLKTAFRMVPIQSERELLGMYWREQYCIDTRLPAYSTTLPAPFTALDLGKQLWSNPTPLPRDLLLVGPPPPLPRPTHLPGVHDHHAPGM